VRPDPAVVVTLPSFAEVSVLMSDGTRRTPPRPERGPHPRPRRTLALMTALSCLATVLVGVVATAGPAGAATLAALSPSTSTVIEGADYASSAFADPWDMNDAADLNPAPMSPGDAQYSGFTSGAVAGPGLDNATLSGGTFSADVERGGWMTLITSGGTGALPLSHDGGTSPIDASQFSRIVFHLYSAAAVTGQVYWFPTGCSTCFGATLVNISAGWHTYDVALANNTAGTQPWSGTMRGLRLNTNQSATIVHQSLDWVRLTNPGPNITVTMPTAADAVWLDTNSNTGDNGSAGSPAMGAEVVATNVTAGQTVTIPTGRRPAGTYWLSYTTGGVSSPTTSITVDKRPEPVVLSPSLAGGDDWATTVRGDAWDFQQASDIDHAPNTTLTFSGGTLNGTNTPNGTNSPPSGDPELFLATPVPIDATTYHRLTVNIRYDGTWGLTDGPGGGMVARVIWNLPGYTTPTQSWQVSNDIVVYPGDNTISVDLKTTPPTAINDNAVTDQLGWGGPGSATVRALRFDPDEDPGLRSFHITGFRLTAEDRGRPNFDVQFQDNAWKAGTTADLYADTTGTGTGGTKIASNLAVSSGVNHFDWHGADVNGNPLGAGAFNIYAVLHDGAGASGTSSDSTVVNMPVQPSAVVGSTDAVNQQPDGVHVSGWALDTRTSQPNPTVNLTVDGNAAGSVATTVARPDVNAAFPNSVAGTHGFATVLHLAAGTHTVCAFGVGSGTPTAALGCKSVRVTDDAIGSFDRVSRGPGGVRVQGWALDPDTATSSPVAVYVDGNGTYVTANGTRNDIGTAFPGYGPNHGFDAVVPTAAGTHNVCAYAINATGTAGDNTLLGCKTITFTGDPIGSLDAATRVTGGITVSGWAIDPDTAGVDIVAVYVDSSGVTTAANGSRPDIGAAFWGYGNLHGYTATISASPGTHNVCAWAINVTGAGSNTLLGCRSITV
jgi:hypothetical protein